VDEFFDSLAVSKGQNGIGVILSGSGSDGMKGISRVKIAGGFTIAQKPETCAFPAMPESAIATGNVDAVLSPSEMPSRIIEYIQSKLSSQVYI
jgi:two-component system CheB/CheR fusion protein